MVCLENTSPATREESKDFFCKLHLTHHLLILSIFKFLRFWVLDAKVLQMLDLLQTRCSVWFATCCVAHICMTDMTSLISFFLILFHYWAALVVYQQNRVNSTTSNPLTNIFFVNHIQNGSFWGCSCIGVQKCPPP